jgi:hypothetical protein
MNARMRNLINVIVTGFIVMVLLSLLLFFGRFFCWVKLINDMPENSLSVTIRPSGLVPGEPRPQQAWSSIRYERRPMPLGPNEPNFRHSQIYVDRAGDVIICSAAGALWDIVAEVLPFRDANERVYYWYRGRNSNNYLCFDKRSGLMIRHYDSFESNDEGVSGEMELFAGPNGVSKTADLSLGRFYAPIATEVWDPNWPGFYDRKTRRFYVIDFAKGSVSKGFQLAQGDSREPIEMYGVAGIPVFALGIDFGAPEIWNAEEGKWNKQRLFLGDGVQSSEGYRYLDRDFSHTFIPVLDKTGRIYIYNTKEQSLGPAGYLPLPQSLFSLKRYSNIANPRNVPAYGIVPVYAVLRLPADPNKPPENFDVKYLGMCVACVSREGPAMTVVVFDPNGKLVYGGDTWSKGISTAETGAVFDPNGKLVYGGDIRFNGISTAEAMYSEAPGSPLATTILFLLENLQPVAFELASYLCGDYFEARAGHQALFILPNSFVGMLGRGTDGEFFAQQVLVLLLMGPSLILSVWLAWRVRKDAMLAGLSGTAKKWWTIGTIAFGLPAYITYRLTRHKEVLVTCQNCGKMRRPDMERCHRCGSKWEMPELTPPNWRICN